MREKLIDPETAKLAKEKGFRWEVMDVYSNGRLDHSLGGGSHWDFNGKGEEREASAPTQALLQKWLREKHKINIEIRVWSCSAPYRYSYSACVWEKPYCKLKEDNAFYKYEEALEVGLQDALKLIET